MGIEVRESQHGVHSAAWSCLRVGRYAQQSRHLPPSRHSWLPHCKSPLLPNAAPSTRSSHRSARQARTWSRTVDIDCVRNMLETYARERESNFREPPASYLLSPPLHITTYSTMIASKRVNDEKCKRYSTKKLFKSDLVSVGWCIQIDMSATTTR